MSDTGVGMSAEFVPHVFERFRQAEVVTTRVSGGLGRGLSIVRHIVEMHGGSVRAESEGLGRGATFRVRLPLRTLRSGAAQESRQHPHGEATIAPAEPGSLLGVRVLAVDDEEDALGLLRTILEAAGAEVITIASPRDALAYLETASPDALVIDLGMPQMDGFEFIARLRASGNPASGIPAAALTAFARSEDRTKALQCGFQLHMAKPVDPVGLIASVAALVRRPITGRQPA